MSFETENLQPYQNNDVQQSKPSKLKYLVSSPDPTLSRGETSSEPSRISWASGRFSNIVT